MCLEYIAALVCWAQDTDQNYGLFKCVFRENLEVLSQARFDKDKTLRISDLPQLVFSSEDSDTDIVLQDSLSRDLSIKSNIDYWKKYSVVSLTRSCLLYNQVRHQVVVEADGIINVDSDPEALQLADLAQDNVLLCNALSSKG